MAHVIIGDIHGAIDQLDALLSEETTFNGRQAVFLGDFVDVGADSRRVIDKLIGFRQRQPESIFLCGNHEFALRSYLDTGDFYEYARQGGLSTIRSYVGKAYGDVHAQFIAAFPNDHREFLDSLLPFYETDEFLFSHCGCDPAKPYERSLKNMVLQSHQSLFLEHAPLPKTVICGHYFQRTKTPFLNNNVICLDTGCSIIGGPLTSLILPESVFVQAQTDLSITRTEYLDITPAH